MQIPVAFALWLALAVPTFAAERDDLAPFLARWGKPDVMESTEHDRPRPPFVTRLLTYRTGNMNVRAAFLALGKIGDPPPYSAWRLIGFQNAKTNAVIQPAEAVRLLQSRKAP